MLKNQPTHNTVRGDVRGECYNIFMNKVNKTFVYFLILTIIGSALAYRIVVKAYDSMYDDYPVE